MDWKWGETDAGDEPGEMDGDSALSGSSHSEELEPRI